MAAKKAKQGKNRDISDAVREVCLALPGAEEVMSHGSPDFRVEGKTYATYVINHHGDRRIALWLRSPAGAQALYTEGDPDHYFVPPYVGPKGWLGVHLNQGLDWAQIADLVREAYVEVAPKTLTAQLGPLVEIEPPQNTVDPELFDPFGLPHRQAAIKTVADYCLSLPEVTPDEQFGSPCWRAGKKNFCTLHMRKRRMQLSVWVGRDAQPTLTFDKRYAIPQFTGHNGWIELDIEDKINRDEAENLIEDSYRHFALKRMLKALDAHLGD